MPIATDERDQEHSKVLFVDYIKDTNSEKLSTRMKFITVFKQRPAWGLEKII